MSFLAKCSVLDAIVLAYLIALCTLAISSKGLERKLCVEATSALTGIHVATLIAVRGGRTRRVVFRGAGLLYRAVTYGVVQLSYFVLRPLLAGTVTRTLDLPLYRVDVALFGVEPTIWLDRFITPAATEWFSFFYFSYFFLLAAHMLPILLSDWELLDEFATGIIVTYCVAQLVYFVVPGRGPHELLASLYQHPLPPGRWHGLVDRAVSSNGALLDIFPSLHTGGTVFIALFAYRHRTRGVFRFTWAIVAFFAANIVFATVFLRWHYLIDVCAGFALAIGAQAFGVHLSARERRRRALLGLSSAWPRLFAPRRDAAAP